MTTPIPTTEPRVTEPASFSENLNRTDSTIRPFQSQHLCFYHKMNGFTEKELIYVANCVEHDRYRWSFNETSGRITNFNRNWLTPHSITIPDASTELKKQQLYLAPDSDTEESGDSSSQSWEVRNGMIAVKNTNICIMWNLREATRLWGTACSEFVFTGTDAVDPATTETDTSYSHAPTHFTNNLIQADNTIRPFSSKNKCFYHKLNGFTENEKIYVGDCVDHDRYRWDYDEESGQIVNWNRKWLIPYCLTIPDHELTNKKQQLFLAPCEVGNSNQSWIVEDGMVKVKENNDVCVMWNMKDKTRLWGTSCGEFRFSQVD